jgi:hypothetical protein
MKHLGILLFLRHKKKSFGSQVLLGQNFFILKFGFIISFWSLRTKMCTGLCFLYQKYWPEGQPPSPQLSSQAPNTNIQHELATTYKIEPPYQLKASTQAPAQSHMEEEPTFLKRLIYHIQYVRPENLHRISIKLEFFQFCKEE